VSHPQAPLTTQDPLHSPVYINRVVPGNVRVFLNLSIRRELVDEMLGEQLKPDNTRQFEELLRRAIRDAAGRGIRRMV
jgi:hypothetical protein